MLFMEGLIGLIDIGFTGSTGCFCRSFKVCGVSMAFSGFLAGRVSGA